MAEEKPKTAATNKRLYRVNNRLVQAPSVAHAIQHVFGQELDARPASKVDIMELMEQGVTMEKAGVQTTAPGETPARRAEDKVPAAAELPPKKKTATG